MYRVDRLPVLQDDGMRPKVQSLKRQPVQLNAISLWEKKQGHQRRPSARRQKGIWNDHTR